VQVFPHEYRRALDEASKLKAAQAQQDALLMQSGEEDAFDKLKKMAIEVVRSPPGVRDPRKKVAAPLKAKANGKGAVQEDPKVSPF
jgi:hypothetical protein